MLIAESSLLIEFVNADQNIIQTLS